MRVITLEIDTKIYTHAYKLFFYGKKKIMKKRRRDCTTFKLFFVTENLNSIYGSVLNNLSIIRIYLYVYN